jgi:hypothetical protein
MSQRAVLSRSFLALGAVLALLTLSCEDDSDPGNPLGPDADEPPPILAVPHIMVIPRLLSDAPTALEANALVAAQLNMLRHVAQATEASLGSLNNGSWAMADQRCRTRTVGNGDPRGCSFTFLACYRGSAYEWAELLNGACPDFGAHRPLVDSVILTGTSSSDGHSGRFTLFVTDTTAVERAWTWETTQNGNATHWEIFTGEINPGNLLATLTWVRDPDVTDSTELVWFGTGKWELRTSPDGRSGNIAIYSWVGDSASWLHQHTITWASAHGTWQTFAADGVITRDRSW